MSRTPMSKLDSYDPARLERAIALIDDELAPLIAARRNGTPDAVRAGIIADLSAERALYVAALERQSNARQ
jgi:hypothetical protein